MYRYTPGPYNGGTLITVTLSAVAPQSSVVKYLVPFNWTRRVYLNDSGVVPVNYTTPLLLESEPEFYGLTKAAVAGGPEFKGMPRVMYDGAVYDVVYPVNQTVVAAAAADTAEATAIAQETEAFFYGFALENGGAVSSSAESASAVAAAAQAISYNTTGCSYPTAAATMSCLTSLEPYFLVTIGRAIVYTAKYSNATPVPHYGRFEPSRLNACMFVVPDHLLTQVKVTADYFAICCDSLPVCMKTTRVIVNDLLLTCRWKRWART